MKKLLTGILIASSALFLAACDGLTTTKKTTAKSTTTTRRSTTRKNTTTSPITTEATVKKEINFYCWNTEFKDRFDRLSTLVGIEAVTANATTLRDGSVINWCRFTNEGMNYRNNLDEGLENGDVDIYCVEPDFMKHYVDSKNAVTLAELGVDQTYQYQYTLDYGRNYNGDVVATTWNVQPTVIAYNVEVAKYVYGDDVTYSDIRDKLAEQGSFDAMPDELAEKGKCMFIGPDDLYRRYYSNPTHKVYDGESITLDRNLFEWVNISKTYLNNNYLVGGDRSLYLWGSDWMEEHQKNNVLCINSCPWYSQYDIPYFVKGSYDYSEDTGFRLVATYESYNWGGTYLCAAPKVLEDEKVKDIVGNILSEMTTDRDLLIAMSKEFGDAVNDTRAMEALKEDQTSELSIFGGQNAMQVYDEAARKVDGTKLTEYDYEIAWLFDDVFQGYIEGTDTLSSAFETLIEKITLKFGFDRDAIKIPVSVKFDGNNIILD